MPCKKVTTIMWRGRAHQRRVRTSPIASNVIHSVLVCADCKLLHIMITTTTIIIITGMITVTIITTTMITTIMRFIRMRITRTGQKVPEN